MCTRRRFEWTHGVFLRATPHTQTPHALPHTTQHNITRRQRQRETERQRKKTETEREDKRKEERQDKRSEERRFIFTVVVPFLVDVVLCLVHLVNDRVFGLQKSVKYDCSLISFCASWQVNSFFCFCELFYLCSYSFQYFSERFLGSWQGLW